jgi:arabinofuranosyltransferase
MLFSVLYELCVFFSFFTPIDFIPVMHTNLSLTATQKHPVITGQHLKDFFKVAISVFLIALVRAAVGINNDESGIDDANIYFVYVRNLWEGHGFVYNPEGPRVEGFTSFLWTIFLTCIYSIKFLPFEKTVLACCFIITCTSVFLCFRYVKQLYSEFHAWLLTFFILLTPGFVDWNVFTLMDLPIWILAVTWATILLMSGTRKNLFLILMIALPVIRPEGLMLAPALVILRMLRDFAAGASFARAIKNNLLLLALTLGSIGLFTLFRLNYFGYPFPNTFYAKVSVSIASNIKNGFFYFYDTMRHTSMVPFLLLFVCIVTILIRKYVLHWKQNFQVLALLVVILFFTLYPFTTGGDHFRYARFFQPAFPLIGLLATILYHQRIVLQRTGTVFVALLLLVLLNFNSTDDTSFRSTWSGWIKNYFREYSPDLLSASQLQSEFDIAVYGKRLAGHMNEVLKGCDTLPSYGVVAAGGTGYVYKGPLIDLMGLNNPEMAHADRVKAQGVKNHGSFDKKVFYRQQVDIFLTWPDPLTGEMNQPDTAGASFRNKLKDPTYFINRVCKNIFNDPEFNQVYTYCKISGNGRHFYSYVNYPVLKRKCPHLKVEPLP